MPLRIVAISFGSAEVTLDILERVLHLFGGRSVHAIVHKSIMGRQQRCCHVVTGQSRNPEEIWRV